MTDSPNSSQRGINLPARVVVSLRAGVVLALANVICIAIFSWTWAHVKEPPKSISVTGSARKPIESDLIVWRCTVYGSDPNLANAYDILKPSVQKVRDYLSAGGISASAVKAGAITTKTIFTNDDHGHETTTVAKYELSQQIEVTSNEIEKVETLARTVTDLIKDGVFLGSDAPSYLYTKMSDLKITMLAEATKDASDRAQQIATNSGATLGQILDARMGVMQIDAINSNEVSGSGENDTTSREKEITAVVSAHFALK